MRNVTKAALSAATMAGAAAAYYLYGSEHAAKHRRNVASWMRVAEREIVRDARRFGRAAMSDKNIKSVIRAVADRYEATQNLSSEDVDKFVSGMQEKWKGVQKALRGQQHKPRMKKPRARKS